MARSGGATFRLIEQIVEMAVYRPDGSETMACVGAIDAVDPRCLALAPEQDA